MTRPLILWAGSLAALVLPLGAATPDRYPLFDFDPGRTHSNRTDYGVSRRGELGVRGLGSTSAFTGGIWPRGTGNQYIFNSGFQVSGIVAGSKPSNPWAGDTSAALFFDASGLRQHGSGVTSLANAALPEHLADWPQAGYLPYGAEGILFADALAGRPSAGDADVWWLAWEGDPELNAARPHPLGIVAEHRVMGWNAPRGNEDVLYVMVTFYNITARDASAYAGYRPGLRELLAEQGERFHELNEAEFAVDLPDAGYTIDPFYASFAADPDVTNNAGTNFASVNLPLAMGMAWHRDLPRANGWTFPADIFSAPFFAGAGLVGTKYLRTLDGGPRIHLYSGFTGGGAFPDPNSAARAFKYMSATITPADGVACNQGDPLVSRICFVNPGVADVRNMMSSPAVALAPGASATVVMAYVHAAPVLLPDWTPLRPILPGNPTRLTDASLLANGANPIDSVAGFTGFVDDNGNGQVEGHELRAVPRSLIHKAQLAQAFFEHRFLAPAAPEAPDFFLVPGDRAVTVAWRPSRTEEVGDPYFAVANQATMTPSGGGAPVPNPLYDANYRQFDVEGYRIWRGRTDVAASLELVAQFDHVGTTFRDFTGQVRDWRPWNRCAPELGVTTDCPDTFDVPGPGVTLHRYVSIDIAGTVQQVAAGDRILLPNGEVEPLRVDSVSFAGSNSGVPYSWRDSTVTNDRTYFYAVTAYDFNAINSTGAGRTSLESPRITRRVTPTASAFNVSRTAVAESFLRGRGVALTDTVSPTIDPVTGRFDKRFPVANGATLGEVMPVAELLSGATEASLRLDSLSVLGISAAGNSMATTTRRHFTLRTSDGQESRITVDLDIDHQANEEFVTRILQGVVVADPERTERYRGSAATSFPVSLTLRAPGLYYTALHGRGCINRAVGFGFDLTCLYNGPRWFDGANETRAHPTGSNAGVFTTQATPARFDNAGELDGVRTIYHPAPYDMVPSTWRNVHHILGVFAGGADYRVHWGTGGVIDSVIDLTHNVPVPFAPTFGASWGILNADAVPPESSYDQRTSLGYTDVACVEPLRSLLAPPEGQRCSGPAVALERRVRAGPIVLSGGTSYLTERTSPVAEGSGFLLYLKGRYFLVELEGTPGVGAAWTLRDYVGAIDGGSGVAGSFGPYVYTWREHWSAPLTAVGVELVVGIEVEERREAVASADLARVHTVPDPYYRPDHGPAAAPEEVAFVNLPDRATIRIYSSSGVLVRVLKHDSEAGIGSTTWDLRSRGNRGVASGVYFYHVSVEGGATTVGRLAVVR